jgi:hypothetical protein
MSEDSSAPEHAIIEIKATWNTGLILDLSKCRPRANGDRPRE